MSKKDIIISASILSSDFKNLEKEIKSLNLSGIDEFHLDIMDGHFVKNISFGQPILETVRSLTTLPIEAHLMVDTPINYIESFLDIGINIFTFHIESESNTKEVIDLVRSSKGKIGIAINPDTDLREILPFINDIDRVLFMTVYPGKGGQSYLDFVEEKINNLVKMDESKDLIIGVDGGIKADTISRPYKCGVRMFVSGTGILNNDLGFLGAVNELRQSI
ncbi:MAG: ribulose-phosphate 3-epimerase [Chloroflexota bacterium]|nr:ribulose-phosphate 3-epimerase [Chloroflexota bacterium]